MTERMTWEPSSKRWVKKLNGRQIWAGYRKLKKMFPALITGETRSGTREAANAFWERVLAERNCIPELPAEYRRAIMQHENMLAWYRYEFERVPKEILRKKAGSFEAAWVNNYLQEKFEKIPNAHYDDLREINLLAIDHHETQRIRLNAQGRFTTPPPLSEYDTPLDCMSLEVKKLWDRRFWDAAFKLELQHIRFVRLNPKGRFEPPVVKDFDPDEARKVREQLLPPTSAENVVDPFED